MHDVHAKALFVASLRLGRAKPLKPLKPLLLAGEVRSLRSRSRHDATIISVGIEVVGASPLLSLGNPLPSTPFEALIQESTPVGSIVSKAGGRKQMADQSPRSRCRFLKVAARRHETNSKQTIPAITRHSALGLGAAREPCSVHRALEF